MKSVAIVGGGITGLVAGFELKKRDIPFALFESSHRVGGVIQTTRENGFLAEHGPNTLLETSPKISQLIRDLGIETRRWHAHPEMKKRFIVRNGRPQAMPGSPAQFLTNRYFTVGAKLALLREPFLPRSAPDQEESLAEFVKRRLGQEFLDYAINPFVAGVYAGDPARLSVKHAFPKLHALEQKYGSLIRGQIQGARERKKRKEVAKDRAKMISFDEGLQVMIDALGERIRDQLHLKTSVSVLRKAQSGWKLTDSRGQTVPGEFSHVLLVSPAHRLAGMNIDAPGQGSLEMLEEIVYPPVTSYVMGFRREDVEHPLDGFGLVVPLVERREVLAVSFASVKFGGRAGDDGHLDASTRDDAAAQGTGCRVEGGGRRQQPRQEAFIPLPEIRRAHGRMSLAGRQA